MARNHSQPSIIPVFIRDEVKTFTLWHFLREYGLFPNPVVSPGVPQEDSLIRTSFTATHTHKDLSFILEGFKEGGKTIGII